MPIVVAREMAARRPGIIADKLVSGSYQNRSLRSLYCGSTYHRHAGSVVIMSVDILPPDGSAGEHGQIHVDVAGGAARLR